MSSNDFKWQHLCFLNQLCPKRKGLIICAEQNVTKHHIIYECSGLFITQSTKLFPNVCNNWGITDENENKLLRFMLLQHFWVYIFLFSRGIRQLLHDIELATCFVIIKLEPCTGKEVCWNPFKLDFITLHQQKCELNSVRYFFFLPFEIYLLIHFLFVVMGNQNNEDTLFDMVVYDK